jgi:hypothetical protein
MWIKKEVPRMTRLSRLSVVVLLCLLPEVVAAQLYRIETENLQLIYNKAPHHYVAPHIVRCFENSLAFYKEKFNFEPYERVTVLLHDQSDFANAGATSTPRNTIVLGLAPFSYVHETMSVNERMNLLMSHELMHIVMVDQATGRDRFFRGLFAGKVRESKEQPLSMIYGYLTTPRRDAPRWYHEGMAVFVETWMGGGMGRAQGAYDEMVFRAKVRDSTNFYDPVGLESQGVKVDFQGGVNSYLYGTRFVTYLAHEYGPEKLLEWADRNQGSRSYFAAQFSRVFGLSLDDAWSDWVDWEHEFQTTNLDSVQQYPLTSYRDLTDKALGSVSRAAYDSTSGKIYMAVHFTGGLAHIATLDPQSGEMERVTDIKGPAMFYVSSIAFDPASRTLFYTTDNYGWRNLRALDLATGKTRMLQKDVRVGDLAFNQADSSLWGVRHYNGISTLVRIPYPYDDWNTVHAWPYGRDMYDIDISADGQLMSASLSDISGRQVLVLMETRRLMAGDPAYRELFEFGYSIPESFRFSPDGEDLYGSSYYTGVSNVFRYNLALDSLDAMTNAEVGLFRPVPVWDDSIFALRYTGKGFVPAIIPVQPLEDVSSTSFLGTRVASKYSQVQSWEIGPPSEIDFDSVVVDSSAYRAIRQIGLASVYPVVEGYRDFLAWGGRAEFSDPLMTHRGALTASYTANTLVPTDERFHLKFKWNYKKWTGSFNHNATDFYDLFGPTRRSRKGNSLHLTYAGDWIKDAPRSMGYSVSAAGYSNLDELPFYQDVPTTFSEFATLGFNVHYSYKKAGMGAIDYQKGIGWRFTNYNQWVKDRIYAQFVGNLDLGVPLPIGLSSVWLRTAGGYSTGDRLDPQANFFFGGFKNNYVDFRTEKRFRQYHTFPGTEISSIGGTNFARGLLELNLPPWRFKRLGRGWLHWERVRFGLFGSGLVTDLDSDNYRRTVYNVGSQIDFRFMLLWHYRMTFSVGYASAFEKGMDRSDEWMFSLKIL